MTIRPALAAVLLAANAFSQILITPTHPPVAERTGPVIVVGIGAKVTIDGPVARVVETVTLFNPAPRPQEFDLIFPLGNGAVVSGLELSSGGRTLEGKVYGVEEARRIYQAIARERRDPALLEHYGEAMFRARVFPVPPCGNQTVVLTYTRVLEPEGDLERFRLPLTAWRRHAQTAQLSIDGTILRDRAVSTLYSPTHLVTAARTETVPGPAPRFRSTFSVRSAATSPDTDFILYLKSKPLTTLLDVSVLSERPDPQQPGYFVAVINGIPSKDLRPEPRDVIFVLDRSGSMQGRKIEQGRQALRFLVERLGPEDRFNVVTFSTAVEPWKAGLVPATREHLTDVLRFIDGIEAQGGTNIHEALAAALAGFTESGRTNQVVFLTDGLPTVGERDWHKLCALAKERNGKAARVIAFGVGFDVNGAFLDKLAVQTRGLSEYVLPEENIEEKVPGFYARMQSPLVLDAAVSLDGVRTFDLFPKDVGDIYGGHQLLLCGRYDKAGRAELIISGRRGAEPVRMVFPITLAQDAATGARDLVARLWAAKKIGYLVDEIRLNGQHKELVDEIVALGTRFGILTEYTSFLAAEETDLAAAEALKLRAGDEVARRAQVETGSHGVAQASNSKALQRAEAAPADNRWLDHEGKEVTVGGCQNVAGRTLFKRGGTWQEAAATSPRPDEEVELFSEAFFAWLDRRPELGPCIARTGDVTLALDGKVVRFRQKG